MLPLPLIKGTSLLYRPLEKSKTSKNVELLSSVPMALQNAHTPKAQGMLQEETERNCKVEGICLRLYLWSNSRSYNHEVSFTWLPKHELNTKDTNKHAKLHWESPWDLNTIRRTTGNRLKLGAVRKGTPPDCPVPNSPENIYLTLYWLNRLYLGMYVYI